jgi:major type 1 subunit fimbrin (pilin)
VFSINRKSDMQSTAHYIDLYGGRGLGAQAYAASTKTGVVNITGKVTDTSCVLDSTATTVSVKLPPVAKDLLSAAQSKTGRGGFSLTVTGCSDGVKVSAAFVPDSNVDAHGNLKNSLPIRLATYRSSAR